MKQIGELSCGHCTYIMSGKEIYLGEGKDHQLNGKPWSQVQSESILLPAQESAAPLFTYTINACKQMSCSSDVDAFRIKLNSLNGVSGAIQNP